jgi:large subunit ribosomal protein L17
MKHHSKNRKFGRPTAQRKALLRSLMRSLVMSERIQTTEAKAKELRPVIEKMVTRAKSGSLVARREAVSAIGEDMGKKLMDDIAPRYAERNGGYTRVVKLPLRQSDAAKMAMIEFV